jgi:hypothetical protein
MSFAFALVLDRSGRRAPKPLSSASIVAPILITLIRKYLNTRNNRLMTHPQANRLRHPSPHRHPTS